MIRLLACVTLSCLLDRLGRPLASSKTLIVLLCVCVCACTSAGVVYVNRNATGATHDGASWASAFTTVREGMSVAVSGDEVWVAASAPAAPAYVENQAIEISEGVALYGGFAGTETARNRRDWTANATIFDGNGNSGVGCSGILDGCVVRNGGVGGTGAVANCTIQGCGIGVRAGNGLSITNCSITGNSTGVYAIGFWDSKITFHIAHCTVSGNTVGVSVDNATVSITDCALTGNTRDGIHVGSIDGGTATITNSTFSRNGTGINLYWGTVTATNCNLSDNLAYGIYTLNGGVTAVNCIVTCNPEGICMPAVHPVMLSHNDVYGNIVGNYTSTNPYQGVIDPTGTDGNISVDPLFSDRSGGDFRLAAGSPCIDAGDDSVIAAGERDAGGRLRIIGQHVDIGAFEYGVVGDYSLVDAASGLKALGGISAPLAGNFEHLNVDKGGVSSGTIDYYDVVWIIRRAAGLEPS